MTGYVVYIYAGSLNFLIHCFEIALNAATILYFRFYFLNFKTKDF